MLLKILIIGGGLYYLYTRFASNFRLPGNEQDTNIQQQRDEDGEYIDYEEVE